MTTSSLSSDNNANSPASSSSKSNDEVVSEMIAMKTRHQDSPASDLTGRIIDMSSPIRSSPSAQLEELRKSNGQTISQEITAKHSEQWMMTNGHVTSASAIHRKSFNIDALLAKSQTGDQEHRFVNSPDSANDCYNEDRRDFTPSPEGHNFRYVAV